jgi:hypothetical protein
LTDEGKSNRRANLSQKAQPNPTVFGPKMAGSPLLAARFAPLAFMSAHLLCVAQILSESQILDAGKAIGLSLASFFNPL